VADEFNGSGEVAAAFHLDVADKTSFEKLLTEVTGRWGSVHVLVNNAARTHTTPLLEISPDELKAVLDVNFNGAFYGCQVIGAHLVEQGYGRIVNIASLAGQNGGTATAGHYASSKGALITATKVFAREFAPRGVTVNAVSPGPLDLPLVHAVVPVERMPAFLDAIPVRQLGAPELVADVVALLASPVAASVTGACWDINGGLFMR
jgi:3-oxoacyl-[acyl-carrier protein] reductase